MLCNGHIQASIGTWAHVESRDWVRAQIPMELQTLLEDFDDVIPEELPTRLPPNIQHLIDMIVGASLPTTSL